MSVIGMPILLILFLLCWQFLSSRRVGWWEAITFTLFGFYLATSMFAHLVSSLVSSFAALVGGGGR